MMLRCIECSASGEKGESESCSSTCDEQMSNEGPGQRTFFIGYSWDPLSRGPLIKTITCVYIYIYIYTYICR